MSDRRATLRLGLLVTLATCCCSCSGKGGKPPAATADRGSQARPAGVSQPKHAPVKSDGSKTPQSDVPSPSLVGTWRLATIDGKSVKEVDESQTDESLPNRYLVFTPDGQVEAYSLFVNTRLPSSEVTVPRAAHMDVERCDFREGRARLPLPRGQKPLTGEAPPPGGQRLLLRSESPSVAYEYERLGPGERLPVVYRHPRVRATWLSRKVTSTETDPKLLMELGKALREVGDHPRALAAFDRAIEHDPSDVGLYRERADLLCSDQADTPDYEKAVADLDRVIPSRPQDADALAERGFCRMRMAVVKASHVSEFPPCTQELLAQSAAGGLDPTDGQVKLALGDLEAALKIEPGCFRALVNRCALSLLTDTDLAPAVRDVQAAWKVDPKSPRVNLLMASLFIRHGLPLRALPYLEDAIALDPTNIAPYLVFARISAARGDLFTTGRFLGQSQVLRILAIIRAQFHSAQFYHDWNNLHDRMSPESRQYTLFGKVVTESNQIQTEMMLRDQADPNGRDLEGRTPLYLACEECVKAGDTAESHFDDVLRLCLPKRLPQWQIVKLLLDAGADPGLKTRSGKTAYRILRDSGESIPQDRLDDFLACVCRHLDAEAQTLADDAVKLIDTANREAAELRKSDEEYIYSTAAPVDLGDSDFLDKIHQNQAEQANLLKAREIPLQWRDVELKTVAQLGTEAIWLTELAHGRDVERILATKQKFEKILGK